jgi:hypothetical protein
MDNLLKLRHQYKMFYYQLDYLFKIISISWDALIDH